ncbi:MAG: zinc ribbon domain-containing protein [Thermoplasmata archaeon]|nr:MAG: zinc ribbon domain-containing protein [Thermoplasmata archaeon]
MGKRLTIKKRQKIAEENGGESTDIMDQEGKEERLRDNYSEVNAKTSESNISVYYNNNETQYCGECGKELKKYEICPKCGISSDNFAQEKKIVPGSLIIFQYIFLILIIAGIGMFIMLSLSSPYIDITLLFIAVFSFFGYMGLNETRKRITRKGITNCRKCSAPLSPDSIFCIYCGYKTPYNFSKRGKAVLILFLIFMTFVVLMLVFLGPPDLRITSLSYDPPGMNDEKVEISITLTNDLNHVAKKEDIIVVFNVEGRIYEYKWSGEDVNYKDDVTGTFNVRLPQYDGEGVFIRMQVYHLGKNRITGETNRNWQDSWFIMIHYR